jgi:hypothetical protein
MSNIKYEGVRITLGQQEYIVPALTIRQMRELTSELADLKGIGAEPTSDEITSMLRIVLAAISRNYPDMTIDALEDAIDLNSLAVVMQAITGQSGLERVKPGEA